MFVIGGGRLEKQLLRILDNLEQKRSAAVEKIQSYLDLSEEVDKLRDKVNNLNIDKSQIEEKYARREREIEHKLGLEKQRQEQELALAKREAILEAKEKNLELDRKRFEDQLKFATDRMATETGYLKEMIKPLLEALPKMRITQEVK